MLDSNSSLGPGLLPWCGAVFSLITRHAPPNGACRIQIPSRQNKRLRFLFCRYESAGSVSLMYSSGGFLFVLFLFFSSSSQHICNTASIIWGMCVLVSRDVCLLQILASHSQHSLAFSTFFSDENGTASLALKVRKHE